MSPELYVNRARCVEVHDGDTIIFDLDLGYGIRLPGKSWSGRTEISCRVFGIDSPELWTVAGKLARDFAQTLLKPGDICIVHSHGWDKYSGRFDGDVTLPDGSDFGNRMIAAGYAITYP